MFDMYGNTTAMNWESMGNSTKILAFIYMRTDCYVVWF
jgi:hypothetical protein